MPKEDELKEGEKPETEEPKAEQAKAEDQQPETGDPKAEEAATDWKKKFENKSEEAARLHKKVEKFEAEENKRKKEAMTEQERLQAERDEALAKARELETKQAQRDAAEKIGLPLAFADRLKGGTPEELEADAKQLLESMPKQGQKPLKGMTPAEAGTKGMTDEDFAKLLHG